MRSELILALDVENLERAKYFARKLYPGIKIFKVGLQLFIAEGPRVIKMVREQGGQVFLDLKLMDNPHTVAMAARQAARHKVKMLTLHISGGEDMLKAAVEGAADEARKLKIKRPLLIGVTVLTSKPARPGEVLKLARAGLGAGLDGVVCSAREAGMLRQRIKRKFVIVTPGIRRAGGARHDQKRTATVSEAIKAGSNFLVIGRPVLQADDPLKVVDSLRKEASC